jgi:hypothetical protein
MTRVKLIAAACATAMVAVLTMSAAAQDFNSNERTYLTFSAPVELPGVTLQAGTYLFKLADSQSNRHIVQVFNQDEKQVLATILAVPAERLEVTGENVVTFRETSEGAMPAVQYWYYPGDRIGHEFVYPKDQAAKIAKRTGQNVLSTDGEVASSGSTVSSTGPDGQVSDWKREETPERTANDQTTTGAVSGTAGVTEMPQPAATTAQAEPQPETVAPERESQNPRTETPPAETATTARTAQSDTPAQSSPMPEAQQRTAVGTSGQANELPRTASPLPLSGLIGLLSLGGAMALRRIGR